MGDEFGDVDYGFVPYDADNYDPADDLYAGTASADDMDGDETEYPWSDYDMDDYPWSDYDDEPSYDVGY
jgi:hypothetical protein